MNKNLRSNIDIAKVTMKQFVTVVAVASWLAACTIGAKTYELESVQPDFVADISKSDPAFYVAGMIIPGIQFLDYTYCYSHAATVREILTDFDGHFHRDDPEIAKRKIEYARRYNDFVAEQLSRTGKNRCGPGENWGAAIDDVDQYLASRNPEGWNFAAPENPEELFQIYVSNTSNIAKLPDSVCTIFKTHGVHRPLKFSVTKQAEVDYKYKYEELSGFDCERKS